ncbi:glycosyltransferase family 2 protein [Anianabacter salinae]|uniref:glycosyltransferase family 2 protein n=1 Tax=Anianabacter salinae TaxID=2851023 RepID=UPI00225E43B3|nr:glycosyltransferase family 2 protein [Anianabacter salinae]MBV0912480.1 glycosyltransferase [Anianabacter salinae]
MPDGSLQAFELFDQAAEERIVPDPVLVARLGFDVCLREGLAPLRSLGGAVLVASGRPALPDALRAAVKDRLGAFCLVEVSPQTVQTALVDTQRGALLHRAQTRVRDSESCRTLMRTPASRLCLGGGAAALTICAAAYPGGMFVALTAIAVILLLLLSVLRAGAALASLRRLPVQTLPVQFLHLPRISLLVPLFREAEIAEHLTQHLSRLDYPRDRLDICLVIEENDSVTRAALDRTSLPPSARIILVPDAPLKTKPRALNYALDFALGDIIGVYDAEDAPAPDQLRRIAQRFASAPRDVGCLQGVLDFYNPRRNWLSRCFTIEYAAWFRVILPGLTRMGLIVPLGGTTLFFRREVLEEVGGWDAHNVTEDADLGVRLARYGYRTEIVPTVTLEEANAAIWPWVRQRSRWLKGYAMTWAVHSRAPLATIRQVGLLRYAAIQVLLLGTLGQFALAPFLWSFWLLPLGLPHPMAGMLDGWIGWTLAASFVASEAITVVVSVAALRGTGHRFLIPYVPLLHLYYPLATVALAKALAELVVRPFYWDKTAHGRF